ncbi:MAG: RNA 2',3'-cyclic phosphodiesterase [Thermodesulfobacteriales bacterium]
MFIAALIPQDIRTKLTNYINTLKHNIDGVKWEESDKLHVTLKFLGDVDESKVDEISNMLDKLVHSYSPFKLELSDFGGFPDLKYPRVLYVGLSGNSELSKFHSELDQYLSKIGFEKESRKFIPHITLGRVKKKINIEDRPHIIQSSFQINQIGLIKSELRPSGSVYTPVKIVELKK